MEIKSAEFVISNTDVRKCPEGNKPEYAFIGRSNVGKSSLINMLTNKKGLAMTSQTPGKTLLINHFLINNEWYLVDLPGVWLRPTRQGEPGAIETYHRELYPRSRATDQPICPFGLPPRGAKDRSGVYGMAG